MAVGEKQYRDRLNIWENSLKQHQEFIPICKEPMNEEAHPAFHYLGLKSIDGLKSATSSYTNAPG